MTALSTRFYRLLVALATAILLVTGTGSAAAQERITFALDWIVNGGHAGYFAALNKGYFREAGLDVTIVRGQGSGDTVKRVASGGADFGQADAGTVIASIGNSDVPLKIIAIVYGNASIGLIYSAESGIKGPKDLEGRKIAKTAGSASMTLFPAFLAVNKVDRAKLNEVTVDGASFLPLLLSRQVDAVVDQKTNLPRYAKPAAQQGITVLPMSYADYGLAVYGNVLMTTHKMIAEKPQVVRGFVRAAMRGLADAFAAPDEAIATLRKTNPEVAADIGKEQLMGIAEFVLVDDVKKKGYGYIDPVKIDRTRSLIAEALKLKRAVTTDEVHTAQFLPSPPVMPQK